MPDPTPFGLAARIAMSVGAKQKPKPKPNPNPGWHSDKIAAGEGWFGSHLQPQQDVGKGWSHTTTAKTKVKRWIKRNTKKQWRTAKKDVRRVMRNAKREHAKRVRQHNKQAARTSTYIQPQPQPTPDTQPQPRTPPADGQIATCRRCSYEIAWNAGRERWEHTGKGDAACFKK